MFRLLPLDRVKDWEYLTYHPLADAYPHLDAGDLGRVAESMASEGYHPDKPVILWQGKVLDGRNRLLAACEAKVEPEFREFAGDEDAAKKFVEASNEFRRHLTPEFLEAGRVAFRARVAEKLAAGKSEREIAAEERTSKSAVNRAKKANAQGGPAGPPTQPPPPPAEKNGWKHREKVERYFESNPDASGRQASRACGVPEATIRAIRKAIAEEAMAPDREPGVEPEEDEAPPRPSKAEVQALTLQAIAAVGVQAERLRTLMEEAGAKHLLKTDQSYLSMDKALRSFEFSLTNLRDTVASK